MDFTSVIKTVAPWIGTALTGPLGGMAIEAACSALGTSEATTSGLKQAIAGVTTEQMVALKTADQAFAAKMQELGFQQIKDLEALATEDRKSARDMLVQLRSNIPAVLSLTITIGYFIVLAGMMFGKLKEAGADPQIVMLMLGSLTTAWATVLAFWFGTTSGSAQKTELLAKANK